MPLDIELELVNHGALPGRNPAGTDYIAAELPYEVVVPTGDHLAWIPTNEAQTGGSGLDRYNCVTQAHHNTIENIMTRDIEMGRMPQTHINWLQLNGYFDAQGRVNFSERFNSILNETIPNVGNYVWKVCEDGRVNGLIPQSMLPDIVSMPTDEYYNPAVITQAMRNKGKEFLTWFQIPYGWIGNASIAIEYSLKQAPVMITKPGHEIVGVQPKSATIVRINDSYNPFLKDLVYTKVTDVMKVLVQYIIKEGEPMARVIKEGNTISVEFGVEGKKIKLGINSQKFYTQIIDSGEPVIETASTAVQKGIVEEGLIIDEE